MPDRSAPVTSPERPTRTATVVSVIIVLAVSLLLILTALQPMPRFPYVQFASDGQPLPRICTIVPVTAQQRQRQLDRCPPEALADLESQREAGN